MALNCSEGTSESKMPLLIYICWLVKEHGYWVIKMSCSSELIHQGPNVKGHGGNDPFQKVLKFFKLKMDHL